MQDSTLGLQSRFPEAVERFFVSRQSMKQSEHTVAAYRRDLMGVGARAAQARDRPIEALTVADLDADLVEVAFASWAGDHSAASVSRAWSAWSQFFDFLVARRLIPGNPMASVGKPKLPRQLPKPLQGQDTPDRVLETLAEGVRPRARNPWPERDLAIVATILTTGLRLSELLGLTVGSLDGRPGERSVRVLGKGNKERVVPIEPALEEVLDTYLASRAARFPDERRTPATPLFVDRQGKPLRRGGLQYLVQQSYAWAGVSGRVPRGALVHALRHTYATRLVEDGASVVEVQRLLGHSSLNTTQRYLEATGLELRQAAAANRTYQTLRRLRASGEPPER